MPFPKSLAVPYAYRHSYCQRHADAGTPMDVLRDLMGHRSTDTTQIYYRVTETRTRAAVEKLIAHQYDGSGRRLWRQAAELLDSEHARHRIGQIAVPFGICAEPSNVQAGGHRVSISHAMCRVWAFSYRRLLLARVTRLP